MFQIPVENLDNIRKVRRKVKGILVDIGLDSCKEFLKDLKGFDPGEKYFYNTSWGDVSLWEPSGKKVPQDQCGIKDDDDIQQLFTELLSALGGTRDIMIS
ncbi:activity-dependent neuroprotector homeobox protein 2 isoform X2 [Tamandua tetradactyla]|uniref:activity-dependent neuroprotector homeobox protein 2 isoform X2 n=1 Tax=Tamandua tetradactyla TaxID=48850 RepID=UPI0040541E51